MESKAQKVESRAQMVESHLQWVGIEGPAVGSGTNFWAALDTLRPHSVHSPSSAQPFLCRKDFLLFCTPGSGSGARGEKSAHPALSPTTQLPPPVS